MKRAFSSRSLRDALRASPMPTLAALPPDLDCSSLGKAITSSAFDASSGGRRCLVRFCFLRKGRQSRPRQSSRVRGTSWAGLAIESTRVLAGQAVRIDNAEHRIASILSTAEMTWTARGGRHKCQFRPGSSVFLKEGYRLDGLAASECVVGISVLLQGGKIAELTHDEICTSRVDLLDHVIAADDQSVGIINSMFAEARVGSPAGDLFSQSASLALLIHVYDRYDRSRAAKRIKGRLRQRQIEIIERYVKDNIADDLSIVELAGILRLSPAYFCRAFSKTVGVSPHRFILNRRIAIARQRLQQGSAPSLAELADALGFGNPAHFSSVFRQLVGCSPSEFRAPGEVELANANVRFPPHPSRLRVGAGCPLRSAGAVGPNNLNGRESAIHQDCFPHGCSGKALKPRQIRERQLALVHEHAALFGAAVQGGEHLAGVEQSLFVEGAFDADLLVEVDLVGSRRRGHL